MKIYKINNKSNFDEICKAISPSPAGVKLMHEKSEINFIFIDEIKTPAANILKQDALSVGAELVTHKDTILGKQSLNKALLMATNAQLRQLAKRRSCKTLDLKLAVFLETKFIKPTKPLIMGVANINTDSFNEQSRINTQNGISKIEYMIEAGAHYIDLGGVSSRPWSEYCGQRRNLDA